MKSSCSWEMHSLVEGNRCTGAQNKQVKDLASTDGYFGSFGQKLTLSEQWGFSQMNSGHVSVMPVKGPASDRWGRQVCNALDIEDENSPSEDSCCSFPFVSSPQRDSFQQAVWQPTSTVFWTPSQGITLSSSSILCCVQRVVQQKLLWPLSICCECMYALVLI